MDFTVLPPSHLSDEEVIVEVKKLSLIRMLPDESSTDKWGCIFHVQAQRTLKHCTFFGVSRLRHHTAEAAQESGRIYTNKITFKMMWLSVTYHRTKCNTRVVQSNSSKLDRIKH